jgi:hypothetical protein
MKRHICRACLNQSLAKRINPMKWLFAMLAQPMEPSLLLNNKGCCTLPYQCALSALPVPILHVGVIWRLPPPNMT